MARDITPCATFLKPLIYRASFPRLMKLLTRNQGFQGFSCTSRDIAIMDSVYLRLNETQYLTATETATREVELSFNLFASLYIYEQSLT